MKTNFKPFYLEYNEFQGAFHHSFRDPKSFSWLRLKHITNTEDRFRYHNFCRHIHNYNMNYNDYKMTAHEMVYALNVFDTTQEIYFINKDIPPYPGVYFLYDYDGNLIYIGKSNNLKNRLYQSIREKKKEVSYFSFALTETDADAIIYEQYYMTKHDKPKFNTEYPSDGISLKLPELYFTTMTAIRK